MMKQRAKLLIILLMLAFTVIPALGLAAEIPQDLARQVANNFLQDYVSTYGKWAGTDRPLIEDIELVSHEGAPITYNIRVKPRGHLLVPFFDDFSPVVLYSDTSGFIPSRISESGSVESWILPEMSSAYKNIQAKRAALTADNKLQYSETAVARAWKVLKENEPSARAAERSGYQSAIVGPLLTTTWDQGDDNTAPYTYNLYTPQGTGTRGTCTHTLTGCVATAWAQMMKYWNWPDIGVGSHSYTWNGQTLNANFAHAYDWANMPAQLTASSTAAQIQAVAQLIYDMGVATDMNYGCSSVGGSGSNMYADNPAILPAFFKYKTGMQKISRGSYTASQWFNLFKAEFDAATPRPIIFSIFSAGGGHEIVSDGYQTGTTDYVHVNMGWSGNYNGYYDVTNNWTTGSSTWEANSHVIVTGIQPDNAASTCTYSISPTSQTFTSAAATGSVTVTASASSCTWSATSSVSWATITSAGGLGSSTVIFSVSANTTASSRTGSLTIAGQTFTITQSGSGGTTATNLLLNPDFESGSVNWTESTLFTSAIITNDATKAHAGNWFAWLSGYNSAVDYIYQDVTIPADAQQPYLQFWYYIATNETTTTTAYDTIAVEIRNPADNSLLSTLATLSNLNSATGWVQSQQYDLSAYKGQTIRLRFYATTDSSLTTSFRIDDVSLISAQSSTGGGSNEIRVQAVTLTENLLFDQNRTLTLSGGYDESFSIVGGMTVVSGSLTVSGGTVTISNIVIQ